MLPSNPGVKAIAVIGAVVAALIVLCALCGGRCLLSAGSGPPAEMNWPPSPRDNAGFIPLAGTSLAAVLSPPNKQPEPKVQLFDRPTRRETPPAPGQLAPGVYKTLPYTCIVVVPGPCPDDGMIVSPPGIHDPMPIIRPDLQFIPIGRPE